MERGQCRCLASGGLPGTGPVCSHVTHFPCVTCGRPAVARVPNARVGGYVQVPSPCGPFKWSLLKIGQFLLLPHPPCVFTARSYGALSSWRWNPGLCGLVGGWDPSILRCPSRSLSTTRECGTARSATSPHHTGSPPLLPVPMVWLLQTLGRWTPTRLDFLTDLGAIRSEAWLCP